MKWGPVELNFNVQRPSKVTETSSLLLDISVVQEKSPGIEMKIDVSTPVKVVNEHWTTQEIPKIPVVRGLCEQITWGGVGEISFLMGFRLGKG
jgi:hypothetical protein